MRNRIPLFVLSLFLAVGIGKAVAQNHLIDTTFSHDGRYLWMQGDKPRLIWDAAVQNDGKILTTGSFDDHTSNSFPATFRFNADGTPDLSFSGDGIQVDSHAIVLSGMYAIGLQSTGKAVVGGYGKDCSPIWSCSTVFTLFRYKTNGDRDSTFGGDGMVQTYPSDGAGSMLDLVVLPDDKIVGVGFWRTPSGLPDVHLARYLPDGALDSTFGTNGLVYVPVGNEDDFGRSIVLQPDGKLLVAGYAQSNGDKDALVMRFLANGSLDNTFGGGDGITVLPLPATQDELLAVCLLPNGKIFATGSAFANNASSQLDIRLLSDGTIDPTFHSLGYHISQLLSIPYANTSTRACFAQPNGKVVINGYFTDGSFVAGMVQRQDTAGNLDLTFNAIGWDTLNIANNYASFYGMALQPDGKMVMVGNYQIAFSFTQSYLIARYLNFDLMAGLEDNAASIGWEIYPNPSNSTLNIRFPQATTGTITIVGLSGQIIAEHEMTGLEMKLDLTALAPGVYFVAFQSENGIWSAKKLVVE